MRLRNRVWVSSRYVLLAALLVFAMLVQAPVPRAQAQAQTGPRYVIFDFPDANETYALYEAQPGVIVGWYWDANWILHGYLRYPNGQFTAIDVPNAANGTATNGANIWGAISGVYRDVNMTRHGFLRSPDGKFKLFDVKSAGTSTNQGTWPANLNAAGQIGGFYIDGANVYHAFVRSPDGRITPFDAPGAGTAPGLGTGTTTYGNLNMIGEFTGWSIDANGVWHGFLRYPDGRLKILDMPGAGTTPNLGQGTEPLSINDVGVIVGIMTDANEFNHGFLLAPFGKYITIDHPLADLALGGSWAVDINDMGQIVGYYVDNTGFWHGFLRTPLGKYITIDPPGSDETDINTITSTGVIVGEYWDDATQKYRGFLCFPGPGRWNN
jgi:hypothetical protein